MGRHWKFFWAEALSKTQGAAIAKSLHRCRGTWEERASGFNRRTLEIPGQFLSPPSAPSGLDKQCCVARPSVQARLNKKAKYFLDLKRNPTTHTEWRRKENGSLNLTLAVNSFTDAACLWSQNSSWTTRTLRYVAHRTSSPLPTESWKGPLNRCRICVSRCAASECSLGLCLVPLPCVQGVTWQQRNKVRQKWPMFRNDSSPSLPN